MPIATGRRASGWLRGGGRDELERIMRGARRAIVAVVLTAAAALAVTLFVRREVEAPALTEPPADTAKPSGDAALETPTGGTKPPEAADMLRVYGTVTDAKTGAPIPQATIRARPERAGDSDNAPPPAVEVVTDRAGAFSLQLSPSQEYEDLVCDAASYVRARQSIPTGSRSAIRMDFPMQQAGKILGRVTDRETGAGVAGIIVNVIPSQSGFFDRLARRRDAPKGESGADGSYEIDAIAPGAYRVRPNVSGTGYLFSPEDVVSVDVEPGLERAGVDFVLEAGAEIVGTVTASGQAAVEGATVQAVPAQVAQSFLRGAAAGDFEALAPQSDTTDNAGAFRITGVRYGAEIRLRAQHGDYADAVTEPLSIGRGESPKRVDIAMERGSTVSGVAVHRDETPAAAITLVAFPSSRADWFIFGGPKETKTDETGAFQFAHVSAGAYVIRPGQDFERMAVVRQQRRPLEIQVDGVTDVTGLRIVVDTEGETETPFAELTIEGTVFAEDGAPAADIRVEARDSTNPMRTFGATTDAAGVYKVAGLTPGLYDLSVASDLGIAEQRGVVAGARADLRLAPPAAVSGFVVTAAGDPVAGCAVRLERQDEVNPVGSVVGMFQRIFGMGPGGQRTDANGAFEFTRVVPGQYVVKAESTSQGTAETDSMLLNAGDEINGLRIELDPGVTFSGVVVGPNGEAVKGASVQLVAVRDNGPGDVSSLVQQFVPAAMLNASASATTDPLGAFTLARVAPGSYKLVATHRSYAKTTVSGIKVLSGQDVTGFRVRMEIGGRARGSLTADGKPLPGAMIVLLGESGVEVVQTDSQGRFEVTGLATGTYMMTTVDPTRIFADGQGFQFDPQVLDIADGATAEIDLQLGGGTPAVAGRITGLDPGATSFVALRRPGGPSLQDLNFANFHDLIESLRYLEGQTVVYPDGSFSIEGVQPGNYVLEIYSNRIDFSNPDIGALINMPRTPVYSQPIEIGEDSQAIDIAVP